MSNKRHSSHLLVIVLMIASILSGCAAPAVPTEAPPPTQNPPTATPVPPTETLAPTATMTSSPTPVPPTETPEPTQTETPLPTDTPTITPTATLAPTTAGSILPSASGKVMWMYFIKLKTGGTVGCGDSAVAVGTGVAKTGDIPNDVEAALEVLFAQKDEYYGELYNPLSRSNIRVESVSFKDGLITVNLRGTYKPSGDKCDNTRVKAQVWSTIRQYRDVRTTNIYLNGIPFGDRVSND